MAPDPSLTPELVHARAFTVGFRGYDQSEVRDFLNRLSTEIRSLREQVEQLESNWRSAEERAARPPVLDEETLMAAVGEETAAILRTARASASELRNKAAEDADRIRHEAGGLLADKAKEAEEAAAKIVEGASGESARMLEKAHAEAEQIRAKAEQDRALTIEGANSTRERILEDLSRRRRVATVQIEQLRAGRERLLESYAVVRRTLEEAHEELTRADAEARAAADDVGRKMNRELDQQADTGSGGSAGGGDSGAGGSAGTATAGSSGGRGVAIAAALEHPSAGVANEEEQPEPVPHLRVVPDVASASAEPPGAKVRPNGVAAEGISERASEAKAIAAQEIEAEMIAAQETAGDQAAGEDAAGEDAASDRSAFRDAGSVAPGDEDSSPVDQLFAKIRAGRGSRSGGGSKAPGEQPATQSGQAGGEPAAPGAPAVAAEASDAPADLPAEVPLPPQAGDESWLQKREAAISSLEVSLTRKLKRALQDEQNDLLDRLRGLRSDVTAAVLLPAASSQKERYTEAAMPLVAQAANAGAEFAAAVLGGDAGKTPDVAPIVAEAADAIVGPLRRRLEQAIAVGASEDQAVLIESLGSAYREWKSQRVERVSGDALFAAFSRGTWNAVPDGARMRWIVDDVDGPCPDCDDDALAGGLPKGEAFPTGQAHPPAHTGCRCLLVPVSD